MKKSRKIRTTKFYFNKLNILCLGLALGIVSQHLPQIKKMTEKGLIQIEQYLDKYVSPSSVQQSTVLRPEVIQLSSSTTIKHAYQPISSFKIDRPGYSLVYDAQKHNPL
jgi:hypothetical protein